MRRLRNFFRIRNIKSQICGPINILLSLILVYLIIFYIYKKFEKNAKNISPDIENDIHKYSIDAFNEHKRDKYLIIIYSWILHLSVYVNSIMVYTTKYCSYSRGLHIIVIHETTGKLAGSRVFDTYIDKQESVLLINYIETIHNESIIICLTFDDGVVNLQKSAKYFFRKYGSSKINEIAFKGKWTFVFSKNGHVYMEHLINYENGQDLAKVFHLKFFIPISEKISRYSCKTNFDHRRKKFCENYVGYKEYCKCNNPAHIRFPYSPLNNNLSQKLKNTPILIIGGDRPNYLIKTIEILIRTPGFQIENVIIDTDSINKEVIEVTKLFDIKYISRRPKCRGNCRVSNHYKSAIMNIFKMYPDSRDVIILEDDILVSPDIFDYFAQTIDILHNDTSIFCISAWNDNGYLHTEGHRAMLYRVQTMPGLGWILKRDLFLNEILPKWPSERTFFDWDVWLRRKEIMKNRDCIISDISRTKHIGNKGINMNPLFQKTYFELKSFSKFYHTKFDTQDITNKEYEKLTIKLTSAKYIYKRRICSILYRREIPKIKYNITKDELVNLTRVISLQMNDENDHKHWLKLFKCIKIWDLDLRGIYKGTVRIWIKNIHYLIIGVPYSPFSKFLNLSTIKTYRFNDIF